MPRLVPVTLVQGPQSWMLGINGMRPGTVFGWRKGMLFSNHDETLVLPSLPLLRQVRAAYEAQPASVFIVEFGPGGPIAEHSILPELPA